MKTLLHQTNPELKTQWLDKLNTQPFEQVTTHNPKKAWWVCDKGHEWEAIINERAKGSKCPFCSNKKVLVGFNDLSTTHPIVASQWHPTKNNNIFPTQLVAGTAKKVWWLGECGHEWESRVNSRAIAGQGCPYCAGIFVVEGETDLITNYPEVASQWHPIKNKELTPSQVHKHSTKKVWWLGECGHEWETSVFMRTVKSSSCTVCEKRGGTTRNRLTQSQTNKQNSKTRVSPGVNDLLTVAPDVASQWHPTKNGKLTPGGVSAFSTQSFWWVGECGHEWENKAVHQTRSKTCPYCSGKRFKTGYNDLGTLYPKLVKEWSKNNPLPADETQAGTNKKAWWVCDKGHEWEAQINRRIKGSGCPYCSNRMVQAGENDLITLYADLAEQYNTNRNLKDVETVAAHSTKKVWWICSKGHEWENSPYNRTYNKFKEENFVGNGCPKCGHSISKAEQEIFDYVVSLGFDDAEQSNREILTGKEIDVFIPSLNIGIEYNGLYWHAERNGKGQKYHLNKWLESKRKGIQLIQIWEDDWRDNKNLWKRMLAKKLGVVDTSLTTYARQTTVKEFNFNEVKSYMESNHLQGAMFGSRYVGLVNKDNVLVCLVVVTFKKENVLEITRFMSSHHVPGGFSKLLKYVISLYPQAETVVSFSENSISMGNLYEKTGFVNEGSFTAYSYISTTQPPVRLHRRHFTKQKYESRPDLQYRSNLTERELADLNGLNRIWEAGNTKWVKDLRKETVKS